MKDALKTLYVTAKAQFFAGFLLLLLSVVVWRDLPTVEHWALRKFVQWQQRHETKLSPDTIIVGIDDEAVPILEKRFKSSFNSQQFAIRMMGDLNTLNVNHVVLDLNLPNYVNTQSVQWPYPSLRVSQAFTLQQMAGVPPLLNYDHIGIKKPSSHNVLTKTSLLYPLVYKGGAVPSKSLYAQPVEFYPSIALSGVLEQLNSHSENSKALWSVSSANGTGGHNALSLKIKHDTIKNMQTYSTKMNDMGEVLLRWYQHRGFFYGNGYSTREVLKASKLYKSNNLEALTALSGHSVVLTDLTQAGMNVEPSVLSNKHLKGDIIATAMDNLTQQQSIYPAPPAHETFIVALMGILCFAARILIRRPMVPTIMLLLIISGYSAFSFIMPYFFDTLYPFASPIASSLGGFFFAEYIWRFIYERDLRNLELNMTQLVSQSVFKEIQTKKTRLEAGGKRLNISSMFVDIRNFTNLSESLSPVEVTEILNVWYTEVEHVANEYRGTVDKYLGDGALVMFGAPTESAQHADMALRAARHLIKSSEEIAERWRKERNIEFSVGVSINSGYAFVGFIGPKNKLEYTAIGDTVNTSSRLQDATKRFHTQIIFSESTLKQCVNIDFEAGIESLGDYKVRGKEVTISTYTFDDMYIDGYTMHTATQAYLNYEKEHEEARPRHGEESTPILQEITPSPSGYSLTPTLPDNKATTPLPQLPPPPPETSPVPVKAELPPSKPEPKLSPMVTPIVEERIHVLETDHDSHLIAPHIIDDPEGVIPSASSLANGATSIGNSRKQNPFSETNPPIKKPFSPQAKTPFAPQSQSPFQLPTSKKIQNLATPGFSKNISQTNKTPPQGG